MSPRPNPAHVKMHLADCVNEAIEHIREAGKACTTILDHLGYAVDEQDIADSIDDMQLGDTNEERQEAIDKFVSQNQHIGRYFVMDLLRAALANTDDPEEAAITRRLFEAVASIVTLAVARADLAQEPSGS